MGAPEDEHIFGVQLRESANDGSDFPNADADYRKVFLGEDGQLHAKDSAGTVTDIGGAVSDILDLPTAETDDTLVLAPDGAGGVEFRAETGGGGLTQAYVGYNTVGGSQENIVTRRQYMKSVTLANDCLITGISAYIKQASANTVIGSTAGVLTDNAGSPELCIATGANDTTTDSGFYATNTGVAGAARWLNIPIGLWAPAGTYWIAVEFATQGTDHQIYYDGSGADRYFTANALRICDSGWTSVTTSSNKYSIRANTVR